MTQDELMKLAESEIYGKDGYLYDYGEGLKGISDKDLITLLDRGFFDFPEGEWPEKWDKQHKIQNLLLDIAGERGAVSTEEGTYIPMLDGDTRTGNNFVPMAVQKGQPTFNWDSEQYELRDTKWPFSILAEAKPKFAHSFIDDLIRIYDQEGVSTEETAPMIDLLNYISAKQGGKQIGQ
tara:strand:+ start:2095 stop:2631 length:537 start_codon:yes stop_codon:yes gene_type:complete